MPHFVLIEPLFISSLVILDNDFGDFRNLPQNFDDEDEAPTVAEITYDCEKTKLRDLATHDSTRWKKSLLDKENGSAAQNSSMQPRKRHDSNTSPPRKRHDSDTSPPRKRHDSDTSPPRKRHDSDTSPSRKRNDLDKSLPKKRYDSDASPPRKRYDSDASPPRKLYDSDASPPRKRYDSDASPPRKRYDSDASPPRKRNDSDASPPRKQYDSDASPPRKRYDSDASPPRKQYDSDASPPRKNRKRYDSDESPPRRKNSDGFPPQISDAKKKREFSHMTTREYLAARKSNKLKKLSEEEMLKKEHEMKLQEAAEETHKRWNKGVVQNQLQEAQAHEIMHEMGKNFARSSQDEDYNNLQKSKLLADDPMLEYLSKKKASKDISQPKKPVYTGPFPPNRFNIRPGYRWDGVDRSNGFENKYFSQQSSDLAVQEDAYRYSSECL